MIKGFSKWVRQVFEKALLERYPAFSRLKTKSRYIGSQDCVFVVPTTSAEISGYLILIVDLKGRDQFTLEVGWSTKGRFPELSMRPSGAASPGRAEFSKEEFVCRLCSVWNKDDFWWGEGVLLGPDWKNQAAAFVSDGVDRLAHFGMPYLDEFFASKGVARKV